MSQFPWSILGIEPTKLNKDIRAAYAAKLKKLDIDNEINAFADLRDARDYALQLAKRDDVETGDIGAFDDGLGGEYSISLGGYDQGTASPDIGAGALSNEPVEILPDQLAANGLLDLLFPDGAYSDEAFTFAEYEQADGLLSTLLEEAINGDIAKGESISAYLADILADSWPRSSPLLERAATHFSWLDRSGHLNEPPSLQFLNLRLRGMRFTELVEQPDHRLHKAWVQLKKPGRRNFMDSLRTSKNDVDILLRGIRERYPEVESSLDPARVTSWEGPPVNWVARAVQVVALFFLVSAIFGAFVPGEDPAVVNAQRDEIAAEMFGDNVDRLTLIGSDPEFYDRLERVIDSPSAIGDTREDPWERSIEYGRGLMLQAVRTAPKPAVLSILDVKRDLLTVADGGGQTNCLMLAEQGRFPAAVEVPEELRARERETMSYLLALKELSPDVRTYGAEDAPLPVWAAAELRQRTDLSVDEINTVMRGEPSRHTCSVRGTLIEVLLERPDDVPLDLLRLL